MNGFIKSLLLERDKLSKLENEVLNYFIEKPEMIDEYTLEEISKMIFVSTATISRTCKKMGFRGFQEFKYSFIAHKDESQFNIQTVTEHSTVNKAIKRFKEEMKVNQSIIGQGITDELINKIISSNHVEFFGVGSSFPVSVEGARKMTFAGRIATARNDWDELRIVAKNMNEDDLAIIVSLSGETLHIIEYVNILNNRGVPTLAITGNQGSHLEEIASMTLNADLQMMYYGSVDMSSRYPLNMILDLLVVKLITNKNK